MKDPKIVQAYDAAAPDTETAVRMLEQIQRKAAALPKKKPHAPAARRTFLIAACLALLAALSTAGYAAYQRWSLPKPERYESIGKWGYLDEHRRTQYTTPTLPDVTVPASTEPVSVDTPITDEGFMLRAMQILENAGMKDVAPESMTVVRQKNLYWDREEAEVSFIHRELMVNIKMDAGTGSLISMYGLEFVLPDGTPCSSREQADALAESCYESLPVPQGYKLHYVEKYDTNFWSYDFCREVLPGLFSEYECVRVSINPEKGLLTGCTVFSVPLLDDHEPGDEQLTQEQAAAAAMANDQFNYMHGMEDGWTMSSAEITVCMPNWEYTSWLDVRNKASKVSRLCWLLTYERESGPYDMKKTVMVDLYTGEILGGDVLK